MTDVNLALLRALQRENERLLLALRAAGNYFERLAQVAEESGEPAIAEAARRFRTEADIAAETGPGPETPPKTTPVDLAPDGIPWTDPIEDGPPMAEGEMLRRAHHDSEQERDFRAWQRAKHPDEDAE